MATHRYSILLFAAAADLARSNTVEITATCPSLTLDQLNNAVGSQFPQLAQLLAASRWAINQKFAVGNATVSCEDEIAMIPPVSGG